MKFILFSILSLSLSIFAATAQLSINMHRQAQVMVDALLSDDYITFSHYTYPKVIALAGGKQKFNAFLKKQVVQMKADGFEIKNIVIGEPGKIYTAGTVLHSIMPEYLTMKMNNGTLTSRSYLLAVSRDKGKQWSFVDAAKLTKSNVAQLFPNFNKQLVIPKATLPTFYKDSI